MRIFGFDIISVKKSKINSIKEYKVIIESLQIAMDMIKVRIVSMYKVYKNLDKEIKINKQKKDISVIKKSLSDISVYFEGLSFESIQIYPLYAAIISMMDNIVTNEIIMPVTILSLYNLTKHANETCNNINNKVETISKISSGIFSTFKIIEESEDPELVNSCIDTVYRGYLEIHRNIKMLGIDIKSLITITSSLSDILIPDFINIKKEDHELYKEIKRINEIYKKIDELSDEIEELEIDQYDYKRDMKKYDYTKRINELIDKAEKEITNIENDAKSMETEMRSRMKYVNQNNHIKESYSEALISNEQFFEEFVSSKHRNRMKKFLKEKNFVPNKNNPNRGMIDSDELDKNHKPKRIEFTIDDPLKSTGDSIQGGTINMDSKTLKQHPDISKSVFSHEVGHNIINNNRDMMDQSIKQINEILDNSGLRELMNSHGNSADEYIADIYSAQKNGIDKCIRTLEYLKSDHNNSKKGYAQLLKSIERDPYKYMVSQITSKQQREIIELSKTYPWLKEFQGRSMTLWLRDRKVKNIEGFIKSKLRLINMIKEKAINKDGAEKYITAIKENIEKLKDDLVNAKREIQDEKNRLRKLTEDVKEGVKKVAPDSESIKRELKTDVENLIKQNDQEMEFRIYIVKNFFDKIHFPKNVSESLMLNSNEQFFAEAKLSAEKRDELKDSDFGIPEERMFPLNDEEHVKQAVKMFKHCPEKYKSLLAYRILKKARQFKLDTSGWVSLKEFTNQEV